MLRNKFAISIMMYPTLEHICFDYEARRVMMLYLMYMLREYINSRSDDQTHGL